MVSSSNTRILFITILWHNNVHTTISNTLSVPATLSPEGELYDSLVLNSSIFVDKSLMIEEFFTCLPENEFHLIAQPPKYGKTTILKMIKRFVEVELDDQGYVTEEKTSTTAGILFEKLKISQKQDIMERHLAQYPVIYIDFNFEDSGLLPSKERALASLRQKVSVCYKRYYWLYDHLLKTHPHIDMDDVRFMKLAMDGELSQPELARSLQKLAELLHSHFRERVIVLIDDYDKSIMNATFKPASFKSYAFNAFRLADLVFQIIHNVLYEARSHIRNALIVGVSTMAAECDIGLKVNNLARWSFLDTHDFNEYFGFTQYEVNELLDKYLLDEHERHRVLTHYDGFHTIEPYKTRIYRPESIVGYLRSRLEDSTALRNYWNETEKAFFRVQFLNSHQLRLKLVTNMANRSAGVVLAPASLAQHFRTASQTPSKSIRELMNITCQQFQNFTQDQVGLISWYLFENGFLYYDPRTNFFHIANQETEQICVEKISRYYTELIEIDNFLSIGRHLVTILNKVTSSDDEIIKKFRIDLQQAVRKHLDHRPDLTLLNYDYDPPREFLQLECQSMVFMIAKVQPDLNVTGIITQHENSIEMIIMNKQNEAMLVRTRSEADLTQTMRHIDNHNPQLKKILSINFNEQFQLEIDLQIRQ